MINKNDTPHGILEGFISELRAINQISEDFFYLWSTDFRKRIKDLSIKVSYFLSNDVYVEFMPEDKEALIVIETIDNFLKEIDDLYRQSNTPTGFFKRRKARNALENGNKKLSELKSKLIKLQQLIQKILQTYPQSLEEKSKLILGEFPYLVTLKYADYEALYYLEQQGFFQSDLFKKLDKYVFCFFDRTFNKISIAELLGLVKKLSNPAQRNLYFRNALRLNIWWNKDKIYVKGKKEKSRILDNHEIDIFFDDLVFDFCYLWLSYMEFIPKSFTYLYHRLNDNNKKGKSKDNLTAYNGLKKAINLGLNFNTNAYIVGFTWFSLNFTEGMAYFLRLIGFRRFADEGESGQLASLRDIFLRNFDFQSEQIELARLWKSVIEKNIKDIYHILIFFEIMDIIGKSFFIFLAQKNIVLSSSDLHDIHFIIKTQPREKAEIAAREIVEQPNRQDNRKRVLVLKTSYDFPQDRGSAFSDIYFELKKLPNSKYRFHFAYVRTAPQIAIIIKNIAKTRKLNILIIGGHGTNDEIIFSYIPHGILTKRELQSNIFDGIWNYFEKNSLCYLLSCSTGEGSNSIAQVIANRFSVNVIAPTEPATHIIKITHGEDFNIEYGHVTDGQKLRKVGFKTFYPK